MRKLKIVFIAVFSAVAMAWAQDGYAQEKPSGAELPRPAEIPNVQPDVLLRTDIPGAPGRVLIVSRTTYQPNAHVAKHYHTSEITFYILEGTMKVQDEGKEPVTLRPGDVFLIKPGTVHEHWNPSATDKLVFIEHVMVEEGQRSAVFTK
jgi:quercetin dioxygenase-like cupin family protein